MRGPSIHAGDRATGRPSLKGTGACEAWHGRSFFGMLRTASVEPLICHHRPREEKPNEARRRKRVAE